MEAVHNTIDSQGKNQEKSNHEKDIYWKLYKINRKEEEKWRIKSKNLWLQEGDKNTSFFHKLATIRKTRNNISSIIDTEGKIHIDQDLIKATATGHYRDLLTETKEPEDYSDLLRHLPILISEEMNSTLKKDIEEAEIQSAIWSLHLDKAPGPNGFSINFYRT